MAALLEVRVMEMAAEMELDLSATPPVLWVRRGALSSSGVAKLGVLLHTYSNWLLREAAHDEGSTHNT